MTTEASSTDPYEQYVACGPSPQHLQQNHSPGTEDQYARVNKKIKQKRTHGPPHHPYVNIEGRDNELRVWSNETPPLPPKDPALDNGEEVSSFYPADFLIRYLKLRRFLDSAIVQPIVFVTALRDILCSRAKDFVKKIKCYLFFLFF